MNDDLEAIDGLCAKIIEQRDRIWKLEAALREILDISDASSGSDWGDLTLSRDIARAALDQNAAASTK